MTMQQVISQASCETLHQALVEDGMKIALRIKQRIHSALDTAKNGYARALRALEHATEDSEMQLLRQPVSPRGVKNAKTIVDGLRRSAIVQF